MFAHFPVPVLQGTTGKESAKWRSSTCGRIANHTGKDKMEKETKDCRRVCRRGNHLSSQCFYRNSVCDCCAAYQYEIKYITSKNNCVADALSRLPLTISRESNKDPDIGHILYINQGSPINHKQIAQETQKDPILGKVFSYCFTGWPEYIKDMSNEIKPYFLRRHQLHLEHHPPKFREQILNDINASHLGMNKYLIRPNHHNIIQNKQQMQIEQCKGRPTDFDIGSKVYARNPLHAFDSPWIPGSIVNKTGNVC
ncbi:hypothetical protein QE152_g27637 [Popillia japonica]|uniref:Uncharacterized protein n=1 Tax=Popillia japonica TaxID=7064 RepID=A0AAW1JRD1_POPJA